MDYYEEIKNELIENETYKRAKDYSKNRSDLMHYYKVGKLLIEAQEGEKRAKYGDGLIKEYSRRLTLELNHKYSYRNLMNMRKLYILFKDEKVNALRTVLSWTHYRELLVLSNIDEINYYIDISIAYNLSYRQLHDRIKLKEYERLSLETRNKLVNKRQIKIADLVKNPIVIKNTLNKEIISEKYLKKLILEDITGFMKELGSGFSFIDSEHKIRIGNTYNYIDILLFNIKYNCYVVVELKICELKKEHIGQVMLYMNYIDKNIKNVYHDKTIGIIICKHDNKLILEYSSDPRIFSTTYELIM